MKAESLTIIVADDDDGHASLVERSLRRAGFANPLIRVRDGQDAVDLLRGEGSYVGRAPRNPVLLLLDIKMPRLDGIEVLRQLKSDPRTSRIPIVMLTTTDDPHDIEHCYELGCSVYITKPVETQRFLDAIRRLGLFLQVINVPEPVRPDP